MSSTYSSYKIELIGTGEQAGTWGTTTNTNFSTAIEQAIGGYVSVAFTGLTKTLTLTDTNAAQDARALYLNLTGTPGGVATLELPAIQKAYIIRNATTGGYTVTAKVTGMTGVVIPNGSTMLVYNNGTDIIISVNNINKLGIGTGNLTGTNLSIASDLTGAATSTSLLNQFQVLSDVNTRVYSVASAITTEAAAFTINDIYHYSANNLTIGAGSTVSKQSGFTATSLLTNATNNYGFESNIPAGTGRWAAYFDGGANSYTAGALGIGSTALTGYSLRIARQIDGATTVIGVHNNSTAGSAATTAIYGYNSAISTEAAAFTAPNLYNYHASGVVVGAGSVVTRQFGFFVAAGLTTATNNSGVYSRVPAGAGNNWNFYGDGNAPNYMAGALGIGNTNTIGYKLRIGGLSGDTGSNSAIQVLAGATFESTVTSVAYSFRSTPSTSAAAYTLGQLFHFIADTTTVGAGSSVVTQTGFSVPSGMTQAAFNYGFHSSLNSSVGVIGFYASGTADNIFAGNTRFGSTGTPTVAVDVTGQIKASSSITSQSSILSSGAITGVGYTTGAGSSVTQTTSRTTGVTVNTVSGAITLVSAAGSTAYQTFTVTNIAVAATDVVIVNQKSGTDKYITMVTNVSGASFQITFATTGGTTTEQPVFNFAVIKAVAA